MLETADFILVDLLYTSSETTTWHAATTDVKL